VEIEFQEDKAGKNIALNILYPPSNGLLYSDSRVQISRRRK
jgi:hypothetical protein